MLAKQPAFQAPTSLEEARVSVKHALLVSIAKIKVKQKVVIKDDQLFSRWEDTGILYYA